MRMLLVPLLCLACSGSATNPLAHDDGVSAGAAGERSDSDSGSRNRPTPEPEAGSGSNGGNLSAGAAGSPVDAPEAGAGGHAPTEPTNEAGAAGEPVAVTAGAGGDAAGGAGGAPAEPDPDPTAGAGGDSADVPPWKRCGDGVICAANEVCSFTSLNATPSDERICVPIADEFDRCVPTQAHPTVESMCDAQGPNCGQVWLKCGVLSYDDAGNHCGNPFHYPPPPHGGDLRYSCGPLP